MEAVAPAGIVLAGAFKIAGGENQYLPSRAMALPYESTVNWERCAETTLPLPAVFNYIQSTIN